ncbi:ABC transporter permease [Ferruginivarius sediminum]|uniref:ABC transporter permease n=1 Tax=Ferruginivarius sediminum TaxID=2661937 RepID=A0A369TBE8_9PROT|nr:ABC transporter permease [Ferruginivarius sediminum]RDD62600.1 ABC transporter permease [Ferruginivarius sediminum]
MTVAVVQPGGLAEESRALKRALKRVERRRRLRAIGLIGPLFLFLAVVFALPIVLMLHRAVDNPEVVTHLPRTTEAIQGWEGDGTPGEPAFAALGQDLNEAFYARRLAEPARRLNYEITGFRSMIMATSRKLPRGEAPESWKRTFLDIDPAWSEPRYWQAIKDTAQPYTLHYLLAALDLRMTSDGGVVAAPKEQAIYRGLFGRTLWMAFVITAASLLMGYPLAYLMVNGGKATRGVLLIFVLLPFWTSLLVRTSAWVVLLQQEGLVNQALQWIGAIDDPVQLIYNRFGVYVGMVHILLPFMVMPIYAVMRGVPASHVQAAASLGATPFTAFRRVYLPQTVSGVGAGCLLVFILSVGFYITPALLGSPRDQMVSYFIAYYTNQTLNWGMASALGVILLAAILLLYAVFSRMLGLGRPRLA